MKDWLKGLIGVIVAAILLIAGVAIGRSGQTAGAKLEWEIPVGLTLAPAGGYIVTVDPAITDPATGLQRVELNGQKGQIFSFTVTVAPKDGYDLPVYIELLGPPTDAVTYSPQQIPAGGGTARVTIATAGLDANTGYAWTLHTRPGMLDSPN